MICISVTQVLFEELGIVVYKHASLDEALDLLAGPMPETMCDLSVRGFAHEDAYMRGFDTPFGPYQLDAELAAEGKLEDDLPF